MNENPGHERFIIKKDETLFLIVDIQERLFNSMEYNIRKGFVKNVGRLIETCRVYAIPIILAEQYQSGLGPTIPDVKEKLPDSVTAHDKIHFDCMSDEQLKNRIAESGKKTVIISGIETHICVLFTCLSLLGEGYHVVIASDAVCSRRKHEWKMGITAMRQAGAVIYPAESISFMVMEKFGTEEFKALSPAFR